MRLTFLAVFFGFLAITAHATSVGSDLMKCPLCAESYATTVIESWNYTLSGGAEPPAPGDVCPHCLYGWTQEPRPISDDAKERVTAMLARLGEQVPASLRPRLLRTLGTDKLNDHQLWRYVANVCQRAAAGDRRTPVFPSDLWPKPASSDDRGKRERFLRLADVMTAELRSGALQTLPPGSGDREIGALYTARDLIEDGSAKSARFAIEWLKNATPSRIEKHESTASAILAALVHLPAAKWPATSEHRAEIPELDYCLDYARAGTSLPQPLRKKLERRSWDAVSRLVTQMCAVRRDDSTKALLARHISRRPNELDSDVVSDYYAALGNSADLKALSNYAKRLYPRSRDDDWRGFCRRDVEDAMRVIRFRDHIQLPVTASR